MHLADMCIDDVWFITMMELHEWFPILVLLYISAQHAGDVRKRVLN